MTFLNLIEKYRQFSFSEHDKGARFERLMKSYLQTDPKYAYLFKKIWLWQDFPGRKDLGGSDTGIDLVALTHDGDYWAIQCKCYQESATIDKPAVDSFLSTSSREFLDDNLQTTRFSQRLWISTTNKWGLNATEAIKNQHPPVVRLNLYDLQESPVDWQKLEEGIHGEAARSKKKTIKPHQLEARSKTLEYYQQNDRGQLIMACGTGKTYTSLQIAEQQTGGKGVILFLVPSIALLGQTLREWTADAQEPINSICICSDPKVSRKNSQNEDSDTTSIVDLALPASTNVKTILRQFHDIKANGHLGMTVVFSTYQSIEVIADAQRALQGENIGFTEFDLIICDEAHRTTGVTLEGQDESAFTKVHDNTFIRAKKRLYMTATSRLYSDETKRKADQASAVLCSMNDTALYGEEIYRIGFGAAVERDLLSDYKVLILTLNENDVPPAVQKMIASHEHEINTDDASKLIGCINALSKQILGDNGILKQRDSEPMKRAVAFCQSIKVSNRITNTFNSATDAYINSLPEPQRDKMVSIESRHIDGTMTAPERDELMSWLKADPDDNECRILTNVRCLSEGLDVPSLDAVMFLSARNSQIDVVQSVGRVMRKSPGKKYGYIIIPVVVPSSIEPEVALNDNERFKVVWTVLNALRAHDDRFNATVNKIDLNRKRPEQILVGGTTCTWEGDEPTIREDSSDYKANTGLTEQLALQFEQLQNVIYARLVKKVGDRLYWENWAKSVADIAERQIDRINRIIDTDGDHRQAFESFLNGLQKNINPAITRREAVEMLSQHIITKPVFEALFEGYSFVQNNPVSRAMQDMITLLEAQAIEKDTEQLEKFYDSVRKRAAGIDNSEGKQRIILELYEQFFKTAFSRLVDRLGIVYTPIEVVDFIIHSVNDILKQEFGRTISDENIHILDPFTGTGTFITRLLQSGLISSEDLERKYTKELHANEIVLLAYYIAAVNIENAYHDQAGAEGTFKPFDGICLTDTFQLRESDEDSELFSEMFPKNSDRVIAQKKAPIRVIIGNPPYSVGQRSANDNAQNQKYEKLDNRIATTYAAATKATNKNSLYDSYIKAFRWSTDRLDPQNGGVICFVSNSAWLDGNALDGFRKHLEQEFSSIYVFNLRGNQRTSGEQSRKEGGKIFGSGSRTPIAITLLVKNPDSTSAKATIHYHDIGDYLKREEKLAIISAFRTVGNPEMKWLKLHPNEHGDWISQRNDLFENFIPIGDKKDKKAKTFFAPFYSNGVKTQRDAWCYNSSKVELESNIRLTIDFYNEQMENVKKQRLSNPKLAVKELLAYDARKISWTRALEWDAGKSKEHHYNGGQIVTSQYRPFFKQNLYFSRALNEMVYQAPKLFPDSVTENRVICVSGLGGTKENTALITDCIPDLNVLDAGTQCFPLYYYEKQEKQSPTLFDAAAEPEYTRRDGVTDFVLRRAQVMYGKRVAKEDIFYYVYGLLHSPTYRMMFAEDLKKMLPRIPLVDKPNDFWSFSKAGRQLADLHINYESVPPCKEVTVTGDEKELYRVEKMRFPKKGQKETIIYNSAITISNIPEKAYEYIVNGKSAIEWIMERYQIKTDKKSGITNDPNDWSLQVGNPRYILDLLLSIINLSIQTVEIVDGLPDLTLEA